MCNLYTKLIKFLEICKQFTEDLVTEVGNVLPPGSVPRFSDLEVIAISIATETEETRGNIGAEVQLDLFETSNIRLEYPYRLAKRTGSPSSALSQRQESGLKHCLRNLLTNFSSSGTMPRIHQLHEQQTHMQDLSTL